MAYSTINAKDNHNTQIWDGNDGSNRTMTTTFEPAFTWIKARDGTYDHHLYDQARGATYALASNSSAAQSVKSNGLKSFTSTGFTLGGDAGVNDASLDYVGWNWKGGSSVSNTNGSITSTVRANAAAGFSIVTWTGTGANATIGHGLSSAPRMIIVKSYAVDVDFICYHEAMGAAENFRLNTTETPDTASAIFNDTDPTSTVFSVGTSSGTNGSGATFIAYCFANVDGYQRIDSYIGNGSADGPVIYTGFKPIFIMTRRRGADAMRLLDNKRLGRNPDNSILFPNATQTDSNQTWHDILANGFKIRTTDTGDNNSGTEYLYYAVGQPISGTNDIPTTAR